MDSLGAGIVWLAFCGGTWAGSFEPTRQVASKLCMAGASARLRWFLTGRTERFVLVEV